MLVRFYAYLIAKRMDKVQLPTFTIPTYKCCSLILTFDDIEEILGGTRLVQVGLGDIEKSRYLFEDLKVNWLFSPRGWLVYASAYNPGLHEPQQAFQYDLVNKRMQFASATGRVSLSYEEILDLVHKAAEPSVSIVSLPCEEPPNSGDANKPEKSKRKIERRTRSLADSLTAINSSQGQDFQFVVPGSVSNTDMSSDRIIGKTGMFDRAVESEKIRFAQFVTEGDLHDLLSKIKRGLDEKTVDVFETDFPFAAAREGFLLNSDFELENLKLSSNFSNNDILLSNLSELETPLCVIKAAAHTKSYVHHLFRCDELSGPIILATVNLFQLERYFRNYRS